MQDKHSKYSVRAMMLVLLLGGFLSLFNETILNVALTPIMREMNVTAAIVQWLSTGYVLTVAVMVPISAFLIHTFTTRQLYLGAMGLFFAGTILAVFAPVFIVLLLARMLQATGTGLLAPIMIDTALAIYPREKYGYVMGICTCIILVGPSVGPIVSGIVLQFFPWRALFILLMPIIAACMLGSWFCLKSVIQITHPRIDVLSIIFSTTGFAALVYGMSVIGSSADMIVITSIFIVGVLSLAIFAKRQLSLQEPMLNIRVFAKPYFTLCAILVIIIQMVQFSMNIILPMLFEDGLRLSSLQAALILFPAVLVCSVMTTVSGRMYDRLGGKTLIPLGIFLMGIFLFILSRVQVTTSVLTIALLDAGIYFGIALAWAPVQSTALQQLSTRSQAHGVAIINTFVQLGSALGTPLFVGLMTAGKNSYLMNSQQLDTALVHTQALYSGFNYAISVGTIIIFTAFLAALLLRLKK
ncbi:MFS transporter [Pectinatus frisingensis]|uniref:MFS transporter n=1 Tax=Pectinatus frisingensis TaxID=865 RepID=UPI0018C614ED|nr:MFS transporter [Pectinatus frisingensis]